jgi:NAD(P)-dependent dehydrogenase (short-subunit alcohol dehydrogenase family)
MTTEAWDRTFNVNVRSMFLLSRIVIPFFLRQGGGVILNTSSVAAMRAVANRAAYSASKGAVLALTRSMALDYASANIRVNCLCPGTVDTPSLHERLGENPETWQKFVARQPLGRLGTAEEIASAALYLVSDDAAFVTGAAFQIDGGMGL